MAKKRLNVDALAAEDLVLTIDGVDYEIRGKLSLDEMLQMLQIEKRIRETDENTQDGKQQILEGASSATKVVHQMILERYPDAKPSPLNVEQAAAILAFVASEGKVDRTVEQVVGDVLAEGIDMDVVAQREAERIEQAAAVGESDEPAADEAPLASANDSPTTSSGSAETTAGDLSGGATAAGPRSDSTLLISTPV